MRAFLFCDKDITSLEFVENIFRIMSWNRECRYKILGRVANSDQGLCMLFDLEEAIMFTPKPQESTKAKKMLRNMRTRSCYQCPYAQRQRVGDITVGDYWGVQKYDPQLLVKQGGTINSKEGVSCLLINTECGQHLVEKYGAKIESYPVEFSNIAQENTQLNRPTRYTRLRNKIFRKYKASGYAGVEAIFERDQRNQKFIWGMYDRICGMFCRKTR